MTFKFALLSLEFGSNGSKSEPMKPEPPKVEPRGKVVKQDIAKHSPGVLLKAIKWLMP